MPRFRVRDKEAPNSDAARLLPLDEVRKAIAAAIQPAHFFVAKPLILEWQHCASEETTWEIYQGRLLDPAHTRLRQTFESWNVFCVEAGSRSAEPILSLKLDTGTRQLHVIRAIHCYAWEGYHAGDNVYLSRETRKWVRELVGTIHLQCLLSLDDLRDEIICLLFQAVVGCSRLPLQSGEAPLPAFSLGGLAYFYRSNFGPEPPRSVPMQSFRDLLEESLHDDLAWPEKAKVLETLLRSTPAEDLGAAAELFLSRWRALAQSTDEFIALCRTLFNEVALSPYTDFVDKMLIFLRLLESRGYLSVEAYADFLSYMLRQNARHLTAYDLITFHHRGANYPDALLLDTVLRAYLALIETRPQLFLPSLVGWFSNPSGPAGRIGNPSYDQEDEACRQKRKRICRRALRQAWLLRRTYEGLPVPDAPTSPGENVRVLPPPYEHVPEEQIFEPGKRTKRLFEGAPLILPGEHSRHLLQQCISDLQHPEELQELGMAVFLDRPFGIYKASAEPDRTLLLSYETFSRSVAERRLRQLAKDPALNPSGEAFESYTLKLLANLPVKGMPITRARKGQKPGAVALHDAAGVADDFIVLRTTHQAVQAFLEQFDFTALAEWFSLDYLDAHQRLLIVSAASTRFGPEGILDVYDASLRRRLELQIDPSRGYQSRAGQEYPAAGLRVLRVWETDVAGGKLREHVLEREDIILLPRD